MRKLEKTWLNREPAPGSGAAALMGLVLLALVSAASWGDWFGLERWMSASGEAVFRRGEWWRLITTLFVHADLEHLLSNSVFFAGLSFLLSGYFGFWIFPVLSILGGALANAIVLAEYPAEAHLIGASGVVYFMAAFWLTMHFWIERRHSWPRRLVVVLGPALALFAPQTFEPRVSYAAHAAGFAIGVVAAVTCFAWARNDLRTAEIWRDPPERTPADDELELVALEAARYASGSAEAC